MYDDVKKFHEEILGVAAPLIPTLVSQDWVMERYRFLDEEATEYIQDGLSGNLVGAVDGLLDIIYVALGTLHQMGIPVQDCWDEVQKANMAKERGVTKRGNAIDAIKPPGWTGPETGIAKLLGAQIEQALADENNGGDSDVAKPPWDV
jgi:predicted HAD superfamily Cof-like phosphohydrolase